MMHYCVLSKEAYRQYSYKGQAMYSSWWPSLINDCMTYQTSCGCGRQTMNVGVVDRR